MFYERFVASGRVPVFDGAIGTMLQKHPAFEQARFGEMLNLSHPDLVKEIHQEYCEAGTDFVTTNTFSANRVRLGEVGLEDRVAEINVRGAGLAREATEDQCLIAGSIGPLGKLLEPLGPISFDQALATFAEQAQALEAGGADLIIIETMDAPREIKAAVIAVRQSTGLPIIASMTYMAQGRTISGTDPQTAANILQNLGVAVVAANCSVGPEDLLQVARAYRAHTDLPVLIEPNAGQPRLEQGRTVYDLGPDAFAEAAAKLLKAGVDIVGSCCGSDPTYTRRLREISTGRKPAERNREGYHPALSTRLQTIPLKRLAEIPIAELSFGNRGHVSAIPSRTQQVPPDGVSAIVLDLNPYRDIDSSELEKAILQAQMFTKIPLGFRCSDPQVLEVGLKACEGIPLIVPAAGIENEIETLVGKYGGVMINPLDLV